jgi:hypothetical protein
MGNPIHKTHHGSTWEAFTILFIVYFMNGNGGYIKVEKNIKANGRKFFNLPDYESQNVMGS